MSDDFPFEQFIKIDSSNQGAQDNQDHELAQAHEPIFSPNELLELSEEFKSQIQTQISHEKYETYFHETFQITEITLNKIRCSVPTPFLKRTLEKHYLNFLEQCSVDSLGKKYSIEIIIGKTNKINQSLVKTGEQPPRLPTNNNKAALTFHPTQQDLKNKVESKIIEHFNHSQSEDLYTGLLKDKTFDNFVTGPSNKMSYAAAVAVADKPGKMYQSLYIHGGSGLGKTHLLHSIGNKILENHPRKKIVITSALAFMNEMVDHVQKKSLPIFRKKYAKDIDVLIIDDIHELQNKDFTQNEFFHIFNELHRHQKQLVFTSDKHPNEIDGIPDRLKTRLYWGLVTEVQTPDLETRIAILKQKAKDSDIMLPSDVANIIAGCVKSDIRELEGSLIKLGAYSSINNINIDIELAKEILNLDENDEIQISYERILNAVSDYYKIPTKDILGKSRIKEIANARHISMYFAYNHMKATLKDIADYFGGRDHTSVLHAVKKIQRFIKDEHQISRQIHEIQIRF